MNIEASMSTTTTTLTTIPSKGGRSRNWRRGRPRCHFKAAPRHRILIDKKTKGKKRERAITEPNSDKSTMEATSPNSPTANLTDPAPYHTRHELPTPDREHHVLNADSTLIKIP